MRRAWAAAGLFLGTLALGAGAYRVRFLGGETYEFCQYAEIASNLLDGKGFTTATFYPCTLAVFAARGAGIGETGPVVDRFPLQAGLAAAAEAVLGRRDAAVAAANVLAHAGWTALLFAGGAELVGAGPAFAAAALWALDPMMLVGFDLHGYPDVLFGLLFLALNLAFFRWLESEDRPGLAFASGVLAGLCWLSRYSFALLAPAYALGPLFFARARGRSRELALAWAGAAAVALPWSAYNASILGGGSPPLLLWNLALNTIGGTLPWCDYRVYRLADFLHGAVAAALARKWLVYFAQFLHDLPKFWFAFPLFPWAVLGLWKAPPSRGRTFLRFGAALLFWTAFCFSFLRYEDLGLMNGRYYLAFASFYLLAAAAGLGWAAGRRPGWAKAIWGAGLGLPLAYWLVLLPHLHGSMDHPSGRKVGDWPEIVYLKEHPARGWVVTNLPTQLTWYAGLKTVSLPNLPPDIKRLQRDYPVDAVYVSFTRLGEWNNYPVWKSVKDGYAGGFERFCRELGFEVERSDEAGILFRKKG